MGKKEQNDNIGFTTNNTADAKNGLLNEKGKASKLTVLVTCEKKNYYITVLSTDPNINVSFG